MLQPNMTGLAKQYKCKQCGTDKGYEEMFSPDLCKECELWNKAIKIINTKIPPKYRDLEIDKSIIDKHKGSSLFIYGESGVGKTVLACGLLKSYIRNNSQGEYISYPDLIMRLQDAYRNTDHSPYDIAKGVARGQGMLVIDDLGAEKLTDYVKQITYYIINEREQWNLPIIITSNYSLNKIAEQIDDRISSRITGMCEVLNLTGKDRRVNPKNT